MSQSSANENENEWSAQAIRQHLTNLYYAAGDPGSFGGAERLYNRAVEVGIPVSREDVTNYLATQLPYSIHKRVRKVFPRNHTYVGQIDQQWQADLADMQTLADVNNGYRYILTCIDILSRFAWAIPVRSKTTKDMVIAMKKLFHDARPRVPKRLQTDQGKEFFNKAVSGLLRGKGIHHFASNSDNKAAVVERFNRTLKSRLWVYFTANKTTRYVDILQDIVYAYNYSTHRSIGMRPVDVDNEAAASKAWKSLFYNDTSNSTKSREPLVDGQRARIARWKGEFEKGYMPNWSREHFVVRKRFDHPHPVYKIEDARGEPVEGNFYRKELQPIPRVTLQIERVLRRRGRGNKSESLVKWLGFSEKFNRWVTKDDLEKYSRTPAERAKNVAVK